MQTCSKCQTQSPDSAELCINCGADLKVWSETAIALKQLQENERVIYVRISVAQDCCPACRQMEGAYAKDSVPTLPVEGCSHVNGCRCFYQPVLEAIYP
ncbi:MAG: zinc-ribbon domain-containing protein [Anaerolineales bacterium]|nr:zinc-ribbon domain-containing protein [Anaerolineales bacterium]